MKTTRRTFIKSTLALSGALALGGVETSRSEPVMHKKPNILIVMTDQQRADTIAALENQIIYTPNMDRLVRRGITFTNAYSTCPVCVPARYTIHTGCEPPKTGFYCNAPDPDMVSDHPAGVEARCGAYIARTMCKLGYRTFGIGKFHTYPWNEDLGFETHLHSEELYGNQAQRKGDAYAAFIAREHPEYDWIEGLMGERTEMYYMPQMSPTPANLDVEAWAADRAVEQIRKKDTCPYFGFISFVGPHPPFAPPLPFNRMYDPDRMPNPSCGDIDIDHMDEQIPWMNYAVWAEDINNSHARVLKSRYYGEISYIDSCLGKILDAVESGPDADNTLICFVSDHGDHLGDHWAWQKESFFESACHVPFLVSWPGRLPANAKRDDLVCLTDLFGIATTAAGCQELRDGVDVLGQLMGNSTARKRLFGYYGFPGTPLFKVMVRSGDWKYVFMANGGREQLFNIKEDPQELHQSLGDSPDVVRELRQAAVEALSMSNIDRVLEGSALRKFPYVERERQRIYQFDESRGVTGFPKRPQDVVYRSTRHKHSQR